MQTRWINVNVPLKLPILPSWHTHFHWRIQGAHPACAPLRDPIFSFWHTNFTKCNRLRSPRPPLGGPCPPTGNPGSATDFCNATVSTVPLSPIRLVPLSHWKICLIVHLDLLIAVCKDSYVAYACGFDRNGKWEWFCESKWRCKNDAAKMTLQK